MGFSLNALDIQSKMIKRIKNVKILKQELPAAEEIVQLREWTHLGPTTS